MVSGYHGTRPGHKNDAKILQRVEKCNRQIDGCVLKEREEIRKRNSSTQAKTRRNQYAS